MVVCSDLVVFQLISQGMVVMTGGVPKVHYPEEEENTTDNVGVIVSNYLFKSWRRVLQQAKYSTRVVVWVYQFN